MLIASFYSCKLPTYLSTWLDRQTERLGLVKIQCLNPTGQIVIHVLIFIRMEEGSNLCSSDHGIAL